jgi:hypothetical protein
LKVKSTLILAALLALAPAPSALADSTSSSNWAGYAVHRPGLRFSEVSAIWTQPSVICVPGRRTYSAYWVGLGGYNEKSRALEQIGTEVDCTAAGRIRSSAWYELVPAASKTLHFRVHPGDVLAATVSVAGHRVHMVLRDATSGSHVSKTLHASTIDVSSADWIVEAPSDCLGTMQCQTLPLANFGTASFGLADAESLTGHTGTISDPSWSWSQISLRPTQRRFVVAHRSGTTAEAIPSALNAAGNGFSVTYSAVSLGTNSTRARAATTASPMLLLRRS